MGKPLISVVVAAYNHGKFVTQTIESILAQDYPNVEILFVDDGSTDNTGRIISKLAAKTPTLHYIHQANQGVGSARNFGIERSNGEFIAICDADDLWRPDKLSKQISLFNDSKIGLVYSDCQVLRPDGIHPSNLARPYDSGYQFHQLLVRNFIPCSSAIFRRSCLDQTGVFNADRRMMGVADKHMWLRLAKYNKLAGCRDPLVTVRRICGNMSFDEDKMLDGELYCLDDIAASFPPNSRAEKDFFIQAYAEAYSHYAMNYYCNGNMYRAQYCFTECKKYRPLNYNQYVRLVSTYVPKPLVNKLRNLKRNIRFA